MKNLRFWYLYDFANSFASAVIIFYFPLMLAEKGYSDNYIGFATAISTLILLLCYPYLGRRSDFIRNLRMKYIRVSSGVMVACLFTIAYFFTFVSVSSALYVMLLCFVLFQVAFQGSYVFYTAQMKEFEDVGYSKDRLSSIGMGFGQLGNAITIGLAGYLLSKNLIFLEFSDKSLVFLFGAIAFFFLSLPYLLQRDAAMRTDTEALNISNDSFLFSTRQLLMKLKSSKHILFFLIGYTLIADSVFTLQIYASLYFKRVFNLSDSQISIALATSLFALFLTCILAGYFSQKIKSGQKFLIVSSIIYIISFINLGLANNNFLYLVTSLSVTGIAYGLFFPFARAYYSNLIPTHSQGEFFSIFVIFERAATILGPLLFIAVLTAFSSFEVAVSYRMAVFSLAILALLGLIFIKQHSKYAPLEGADKQIV